MALDGSRLHRRTQLMRCERPLRVLHKLSPPAQPRSSSMHRWTPALSSPMSARRVGTRSDRVVLGLFDAFHGRCRERLTNRVDNYSNSFTPLFRRRRPLAARDGEGGHGRRNACSKCRCCGCWINRVRRSAASDHAGVDESASPSRRPVPPTTGETWYSLLAESVRYLRPSIPGCRNRSTRTSRWRLVWVLRQRSVYRTAPRLRPRCRRGPTG